MFLIQYTDLYHIKNDEVELIVPTSISMVPTDVQKNNMNVEVFYWLF